MTQRIDNPAQRMFDASGNMLSKGKLNFYAPLTTEGIDTYSDPDLATTNDKTVVLDEYGMAPDVFIEGAYKARLRSSGDVQQWNRDYVNPYNLAPFDPWSAGVIYSIGGQNIVTKGGKYFVSITDDNLDRDPEINPDYWQEVEFLQGGFNSQNIKDLGEIPPTLSNIIIGKDSRWSQMLVGGMSSSYIGGLKTTCYPDLSSVTGITVAPGACADSNGRMIASPATMTKLIGFNWEPGDGEGGLASGVSSTTNTWYFLFAVIIEGEVDFIFDTSPGCENGITGNGVQAYRMIAAVRTAGVGQISPYIQYGRRFIFQRYIQASIATAPDATGALNAIVSPLGIKANTTFVLRKNVTAPGVSGTEYVIMFKITSPDQADVPVDISNCDLICRDTSVSGTSYASVSVIMEVTTDTQSRVRARAGLINILSSAGVSAQTISFTL